MGPTHLPWAPEAVLMPPWDLGRTLGVVSWQACLCMVMANICKSGAILRNTPAQTGRLAAWKCVLLLLLVHSREAGLSAIPCALHRAWYCRLNFCWWEQRSLLIHYVTSLISLRQKHYQLHWWLDIVSRHQNQNQYEFCYPDDVYKLILKASEYLR